MIRASQLIGILQEYSIPLIVGVVAGLAMANIDFHSYEELVDFHVFGEDFEIFGREVTAHFLINEIFMVFFFGIAAKEITESVLPGGALNPVTRAINPLMGTLGGALGPVGLFFILTLLFYGGTDDFSAVANGWGIPTATDIALAWLVARMIFGAGHPAVNFLLLLAVADDAIGLGIIAVFYPDPEHPVEPIWVLLIVGGMATAYLMRRVGVRQWPVYVLIAGGMSWVGLVKSGVEPALALVVIVPFLPALKPQVGRVQEQTQLIESARSSGGAASGNPGQAGMETLDHPGTGGVHAHGGGTLDQFEHHLKLPVDFGLFFFAFANAGVAFASINQVTFIVLLSLIAGKMLGISVFSLAGTKLGFPLPSGMRVRHLVVTSIIAGLGLTVALFVANKAYEGPPFQDPAKMGAVLSAGAAVLAFAAARLFRIKRSDAVDSS